MINGYKIIGMCITKVNDEDNTNLTEYLSVEAIKNGYRLFVFNSFRDFYYDNDYDRGSMSIYKAVNFDILDALIIDDRSFYDKSIPEELINKAKKHNIPVILLNFERDDCFCIVNDYSEVFKNLIRHVITEHNAKKVNFIAGIKDEEDSETRLECYKAVMEEYNMPISDGQIEYGDYWNVPVYRIIDKWVEKKELPDAIICVNDSSAIDVCERLNLYGYTVPKDVIVTGFDGIQSASFHTPQITTCRKDIESLAKDCVALIRSATEDSAKPTVISRKHSNFFSESCGCVPSNGKDFREHARMFYNNLTDMRQHESALYSWADKIIESTDLGVIGENLHDNILPGSAVCLNNNFISMVRKGEKTNPEQPFTSNMIVVSMKDESYKSQQQEVFPLSDIYPRIEKHIGEEVLFIFQPIYVADKVCGYYAMKTPDIAREGHKIHRLTRIMNIAFGTLVSRIEQNHMISRIEDMQFRDPLTELLNLKGLINKMKEIRDYAQTKRIAVSVYSIAQYKYIYENYGIQDIEEAVSLVSESLQLANTANSVIARIADDEFAVINLEDPEVDMGAVIVNSVAIFFSNVEGFNSSQNKDYYVEVNCGCTVAEPGWDNDIETFLKIASGELYLNRLKSGRGPVLKETKTPKESYVLFDLLIEKNLFFYHFQPIVSAKTGEIYAYEALMRTSGEINMSPGEILQIATDYKRLYDIEYATLNNVLGFVDKNAEKFEGKRIFINTIPGHFLNQEDYDSISTKYAHILKNCVIEITEQGEISDDELNRVKNFGGDNSGCQLAIDDYGAGNSNIVNLLRYKPNVIKIDRFLISQIQNDINKQMFVKNVIDFAQMNGIMTIAEGVETCDELSAVISYGVDLIQGYYTARPAPEPLNSLPDNILEDIRQANAV